MNYLLCLGAHALARYTVVCLCVCVSLCLCVSVCVCVCVCVCRLLQLLKDESSASKSFYVWGVICVKMTMTMYTRVHSYARYNMHACQHPYARYNIHGACNMHMHLTTCIHCKNKWVILTLTRVSFDCPSK